MEQRKNEKKYEKNDSGAVEYFDAVVRNTSTLKESGMDFVSESVTIVAILKGIAGAAFVLTLIKVIIPVLHELTSALYCARQSISEYFEIQSNIVQFNAEQLKYSYTKSEDQIQKIYEKQTKIADMFKKISSKFAVKMSKAESDAKKQIQKDKSEKYKVDDLELEDVPATTSSIF